MKAVDISPLAAPGVRHAADDGAEHERSHEGEEQEVDEAFQSVVAQSRHALNIVLQDKFSLQSNPYSKCQARALYAKSDLP